MARNTFASLESAEEGDTRAGWMALHRTGLPDTDTPSHLRPHQASPERGRPDSL